MSEYPLGHRHAEDDRDLVGLQKLTPVPAGQSRRRHRYHTGGWMGDQNNAYSVRDRRWGPRPWCVSYGTLRWVEIMGRPLGAIDPWTVEAFMRECEDHDEWTGNIDQGSSGRAAFKVLHRRGVVSSYHRAESIEALYTHVLEVGPIGVGTPWHRAMFDPDELGFVKPEGPIRGHHWWIVSGINMERGVARGDNSWSERWGIGGRFWTELEHLEQLVFGGQGDAWWGVLA